MALAVGFSLADAFTALVFRPMLETFSSQTQGYIATYRKGGLVDEQHYFLSALLKLVLKPELH